MNRAFIVFLLIFAFSPTLARAEVFVWQDEDTKLTVSYPDRWGMVSDQKPGDVLTVLAPVASNGDDAGCRLRTRVDGRFKIFPRKLAGAVQRTQVSQKFWDMYVQEFTNPVVQSVTDNAALGDGFASMAQVSFTPANAATYANTDRRQGMMLATIYNDKAYVLECSTAAGHYADWQDQFMSILKSVSFRREYASPANGHYRDFLSDDPVWIKGERAEDDRKY